MILLAKLEQQFSATCQAILQYLPSETATVAPMAAAPINQPLREKLQRLTQLLAGNDGEALECFDQLRDELAALTPREDFSALEQLISRFQWQDAERKIAALLAKGES